jgi:hypothetical protein
MTTINLVSGDYDIDSQGHHVCDENGFAIVLTESKQVDVTEQSDIDRIQPILEAYRVARGLNPDGSEIEE